MTHSAFKMIIVGRSHGGHVFVAITAEKLSLSVRMLPEEDGTMATGLKMNRKCDKAWSCHLSDMRADRQTDRQTQSSKYFTHVKPNEIIMLMFTV